MASSLDRIQSALTDMRVISLALSDNPLIANHTDQKEAARRALQRVTDALEDTFDEMLKLGANTMQSDSNPIESEQFKQSSTNTAYHEAGHFVAGFHFGHQQAGISIIPDSQAGTLGAVRAEPFESYVDEVGDLLPGILEAGEEEIITLLAGYHAEMKFVSDDNYATIAQAGVGKSPTLFLPVPLLPLAIQTGLT